MVRFTLLMTDVVTGIWFFIEFKFVMNYFVYAFVESNFGMNYFVYAFVEIVTIRCI